MAYIFGENDIWNTRKWMSGKWLRLSPQARGLWALALLYKGETNCQCLDIDEIAFVTNLSKESAQDAVHELLKADLVEVDEDGDVWFWGWPGSPPEPSVAEDEGYIKPSPPVERPDPEVMAKNAAEFLDMLEGIERKHAEEEAAKRAAAADEVS